MSLGTILLIVLILALVGALPMWPYKFGLGLLPDRRLRPARRDHPRSAVARQDLILLFGYAPAIAGVVTPNWIKHRGAHRTNAYLFTCGRMRRTGHGGDSSNHRTYLNLYMQSAAPTAPCHAICMTNALPYY